MRKTTGFTIIFVIFLVMVSKQLIFTMNLMCQKSPVLSVLLNELNTSKIIGDSVKKWSRTRKNISKQLILQRFLRVSETPQNAYVFHIISLEKYIDRQHATPKSHKLLKITTI